MRRPLVWMLAMLIFATAPWLGVETSSADGPGITSSLHQHASWTKPSPCRRVVLVHGFSSQASSLSPLADQLARDGCSVATFQYDSHNGVQSAAEQLGHQIATIAKDRPQDSIALVTHSMGGLVARWLLEQDAQSPVGSEKVDRLIMVAPPNAGSALASLNASSLIARGGVAKSLTPEQQQQIDELDQSLASMLGIAVGDLRPDSTVLQKLATPKIPASVHYSILAGDDGPMPAETAGIGLALKLAAAVAGPRRDAIAKPDDSATLGKMVSVAGDWLELAGQPEWVSGQGDGVVSVASTRLLGVDDHQVLPFRHNSLTGNLASDGGRQLLQAIKQRLRTNR